MPEGPPTQGCGHIAVNWKGIGGSGEQAIEVDWEGPVSVGFQLPNVNGATIGLEFSPAPMFVKFLEVQLLDSSGNVVGTSEELVSAEAGVLSSDGLAVLKAGRAAKILAPEAAAPIAQITVQAERVGAAVYAPLATAIREAFEERDAELVRFTNDIDQAMAELARRHAPAINIDERLMMETQVRQAVKEREEMRRTLTAMQNSRLWKATRAVARMLGKGS